MNLRWRGDSSFGNSTIVLRDMDATSAPNRALLFVSGNSPAAFVLWGKTADATHFTWLDRTPIPDSITDLTEAKRHVETVFRMSAADLGYCSQVIHSLIHHRSYLHVCKSHPRPDRPRHQGP
jgi:hypothetical protein